MKQETKEFMKAWESHLKDFGKLKSTLHPSDWAELDSVKDTMFKMIAKAGAELEKEDE